MGIQRKPFVLAIAMVLGATSLYTVSLNRGEREVEEERAQRSPQTPRAALQEKSVSAAGSDARAAVLDPANSPATQIADEASPANTVRLLDGFETDSNVEPRPLSKSKMFEAKRRELLETGQYEQLDRFEAKLSYEEKRKELNRWKREQLRELDRERRDLSRQLAETDDPELKEELRAPLRELRSQREEARYVFELEARQAREEFRKINEH